jgi:hypothetical protein
MRGGDTKRNGGRFHRYVGASPYWRNTHEDTYATAAVLTAFATPVLADFWIVREGPTGPCRIVETRPTDTKIIVVGNKAYKVRAEAEKELAVVCK